MSAEELHDNVHPSPQGHALLAGVAARYVASLLAPAATDESAEGAADALTPSAPFQPPSALAPCPVSARLGVGTWMPADDVGLSAPLTALPCREGRTVRPPASRPPEARRIRFALHLT